LRLPRSLVNYVKECSGRDDLEGASLVRTVFSKNNPVLKFNALATPTDLDEQEGMMHLFEGAVLAVRNPGGHAIYIVAEFACISRTRSNAMRDAKHISGES
jgi:uncharacterized protein (TIGR02391 family)